MKNYGDRGECYPPKQKAEVGNTLPDLHNSSYHTKAEFNNGFFIYSKYFQSSKNTKCMWVLTSTFLQNGGQFLRFCWILDVSLLKISFENQVISL